MSRLSSKQFSLTRSPPTICLCPIRLFRNEDLQWTDDDADKDQWVDYDSENYVDKEQREKEEEIDFQRQLQAIKSKARPFTEFPSMRSGMGVVKIEMIRCTAERSEGLQLQRERAIQRDDCS